MDKEQSSEKSLPAALIAIRKRYNASCGIDEFIEVDQTGGLFRLPGWLYGSTLRISTKEISVALKRDQTFDDWFEALDQKKSLFFRCMKKSLIRGICDGDQFDTFNVKLSNYERIGDFYVLTFQVLDTATKPRVNQPVEHVSETKITTPVSDLVELIEKQQQFFRGCAELDGLYFDLACREKLTEKRQRPPRRGWTRFDLKRCEYEIACEDYDFEESDAPLSQQPRAPKYRTRLETTFRVQLWRKTLASAAGDAVQFCSRNIAFTDTDAATIRIAVESHQKWVHAYVHMSEETPMRSDETNRWLETLETLKELAKSAALLQYSDKEQTQSGFAPPEDLARFDERMEDRRFFAGMDEHSKLLEECKAAWKRSRRTLETIPPTLEAIADYVSHEGKFNYSILASLESWLLKHPLPSDKQKPAKATKTKLENPDAKENDRPLTDAQETEIMARWDYESVQNQNRERSEKVKREDVAKEMKISFGQFQRIQEKHRKRDLNP